MIDIVRHICRRVWKADHLKCYIRRMLNKFPNWNLNKETEKMYENER